MREVFYNDEKVTDIRSLDSYFGEKYINKLLDDFEGRNEIIYRTGNGITIKDYSKKFCTQAELLVLSFIGIPATEERLDSNRENGCLTVNEGRDSRYYIWYHDENNDVVLDIETMEFTDKENIEETIERLFL